MHEGVLAQTHLLTYVTQKPVCKFADMCASVHANAYDFLHPSLWLSHPSEVGFLIISLLNQCSQGENQKAQGRHQSLLEPKTQGTYLGMHPDMHTSYYIRN